jgi:hypothetical protein
MITKMIKVFKRLDDRTGETFSFFINSVSIHPDKLCDEDYLNILNSSCELLKIKIFPYIISAFESLLKVETVNFYFFS